MNTPSFVHLHTHSEYSLLDGSSKVKELVSRALALGMDALAITDHGVMFGVVDFYKEAVAAGLKPVLGCEVYVASGSRHNKVASKDNFYNHLVLLAENNTGYHNLIKLVSAGFTEGFYYKPRVDMELLQAHSEGLIALSACLSGPVAKTLLQGTYEDAKAKALALNSIFGQNNFFLELQEHGLPEQKQVNPSLVRMSQETGIPLVCTNDAHYIYKEDAAAHDLLLCIQTNTTVEDDDRMTYEGQQFYLKSPEEMAALFPYCPEALTNTANIAERCNVQLTFNEYKLPRFPIPEGEGTAFHYLNKLCREGLVERYGEATAQELASRMDYELSVISTMGFCDYFLIVWDFIRHAREQGIMVGPGRGSAAGSLVAYCLRITNIDPIKHALLFERFLNPERISMPDIDIDFCYERRQEVIDYVVAKYGADHVAQIITFGTMGARAVIRDVGRALAMPYADVDRLAKMIPFAIGMNIDRALELNPELKAVYDNEEAARRLIDMSKRLEGLPRHASTHAAGVVICNEPVTSYVPLYQNDGVLTTQFPMTTLEELGLLKMDFLGLRTLTVIQNAVAEIKRNHGVDIDIDHIDFADPKVFELISAAKTEGIFQLESAGMKAFMRELQPECLEDIIAGISLYRPGPMDFIPKYVRGKRDKASIRYTHPALEPILKATYGCIVYQEQVMQIVRELAGYSLGRSDLVRRAMSKKKVSVMEEERKNFVYGLGEDVPGCVKQGIPKEAAEKIFEDMADFAKYAFNKSHAAAYAVIGYQTGWLKVYYPVEFMAALMTSVMDHSSKVAEYIAECKKMGIALLPPDVNDSFGHFSVKGPNIRFGLHAIKNVGRPAISALVAERAQNGPFTSMTDFISRLQTRDLNKRCLESLILAGGFDSLGGKRSQYMQIYKNILNAIGQNKRQNLEGQLNLFDMGGSHDAAPTKQEDMLPDVQEFDPKTLLAFEKEMLGVYVSGHPLSAYQSFLQGRVNTTSLDLARQEDEEETFQEQSAAVTDGQSVCVGGIIQQKSVKYTKTGNKAMAFLTLEDLTGNIEVIVFPQIYEKYMGRPHLEIGQVIAVTGKASVKEDEDAKVMANELILFEDNQPEAAEQGFQQTLYLKIPALRPVSDHQVTALLSAHKGPAGVVVFKEATGERFRLTKDYCVNVNAQLIEQLKGLLGENCVILR